MDAYTYLKDNDLLELYIAESNFYREETLEDLTQPWCTLSCHFDWEHSQDGARFWRYHNTAFKEGTLAAIIEEEDRAADEAVLFSDYSNGEPNLSGVSRGC